MNVAFALVEAWYIPQIAVPKFKLPVSFIVFPATVDVKSVSVNVPLPVYASAGSVAVAPPVERKVILPVPLIVVLEPKLKNAPLDDLVITIPLLIVNVALSPIVTLADADAVEMVNVAVLELVTLAPAPSVIGGSVWFFEIDIVIPVVPFIVKAQDDDVTVPTPEAIDNVALAPFIVNPLPRFSVPV